MKFLNEAILDFPPQRMFKALNFLIQFPQHFAFTKHKFPRISWFLDLRSIFHLIFLFMKNVNKTPTLNKADGCSNLWHDYPYWHSVIQIKLSDIVHLPLNFNDDAKLMINEQLLYQFTEYFYITDAINLEIFDILESLFTHVL